MLLHKAVQVVQVVQEERVALVALEALDTVAPDKVELDTVVQALAVHPVLCSIHISPH